MSSTPAGADGHCRRAVRIPDAWPSRQGLIPDELIAAAAGVRDALPEDTVVIVVGSSSHAMHRVVGSVAVSLARRSAVPLVVVP